MTSRQFLNEYRVSIAWRRGVAPSQVSPHTLRAMRGDLRAFETWMEQAPERCAGDARAWLMEESARLAPATVSRRLASLRTYANWRAENGDKEILDALRGCSVRSRTERVYCPDPTTMDSVAAAARRARNDLNGIAVMLIRKTGARVGEICGLRSADIARQPNGDSALSLMGKGGRERTVVVRGLSAADLDCLARCDDNIIFGRGAYTRLWRLIRAAAGGLGLNKFTPHSFRHGVATELLSAGVPIQVVSRWLGHAKIETTLRTYVHTFPGDMSTCAGVLS